MSFRIPRSQSNMTTMFLRELCDDGSADAVLFLDVSDLRKAVGLFIGGGSLKQLGTHCSILRQLQIVSLPCCIRPLRPQVGNLLVSCPQSGVRLLFLRAVFNPHEGRRCLKRRIRRSQMGREVTGEIPELRMRSTRQKM